MARIEWIRGRIHGFLRHRYSRQARLATATYDDWGNPEMTHESPPAAPAETDLLCYFMDAGSYLQGGAGVIQVNVPTLVVEYTDPLKIGDLVLQVTDPKTGYVLVGKPALVEMFGDVATSGPMLYRMASLRYADVA